MGVVAGLLSFNGDIDITKASTGMKERLVSRMTEGAGETAAKDKYIYGSNFLDTELATLCYDGSIYNIEEIKQDLNLKDASSSEVLYKLYKEKGIDFISHVNGDFVIVVFDKKLEKLYIFRDRFGLKPVYYYNDASKFVFASESKGIFGTGLVEKKPNMEMLYNYVGTHYRYVYIKPDRTFYENVARLPVSSYLEFDVKTRTPQIKRYWKLELQDLSNIELEDIKAEYMRRLKKSVQTRLGDYSVDQLGFSLSGGMDSSTVTALSSMQMDDKLNIYSSVFDDKTYDESKDIMPSKNKFAHRWNDILITGKGLADTLNDMVKRFDEPVPTATYYSNNVINQHARKDGVEIFFSGLGGDECNAGEYEHFLFFFADLKHRGLEDRLKEEVKWWMKYHDHPVFKKDWNLVNRIFTDYVDLQHPCVNRLDKDRYDFYKSVFNNSFISKYHYYPQSDNPYQSYLINRIYQDLFYETIPTCLNADDRIASTYGLQTRFPFLDHEVLEYAFSIPIEYKYKNGVTKAVLRDMMRGILPNETVNNVVKTGWNAPANEWIKTELKETIMDVIEHPNEIEKEMYNTKEIERFYKEHFEGGVNHMMFFWQLANLRIWLANNF